MSQFDNDIRSALLDKLDSVHASEDLIASTLKSISLEENLSSGSNATPDKVPGTLSAIDTRFIRNHVKALEKNHRRQNNIKRAAIVLGSIAATLLVLSGGLLATSIATKRAAIANSKRANYAYITWDSSYNAALYRAYSEYDYNAYIQFIEDSTMEPSHGLNNSLNKLDENSKLRPRK